jgi:hypothetical protein
VGAEWRLEDRGGSLGSKDGLTRCPPSGDLKSEVIVVYRALILIIVLLYSTYHKNKYWIMLGVFFENLGLILKHFSLAVKYVNLHL